MNGTRTACGTRCLPAVGAASSVWPGLAQAKAAALADWSKHSDLVDDLATLLQPSPVHSDVDVGDAEADLQSDAAGDTVSDPTALQTGDATRAICAGLIIVGILMGALTDFQSFSLFAEVVGLVALAIKLAPG